MNNWILKALLTSSNDGHFFVLPQLTFHYREIGVSVYCPFLVESVSFSKSTAFGTVSAFPESCFRYLRTTTISRFHCSRCPVFLLWVRLYCFFHEPKFLGVTQLPFRFWISFVDCLYILLNFVSRCIPSCFIPTCFISEKILSIGCLTLFLLVASCCWNIGLTSLLICQFQTFFNFSRLWSFCLFNWENVWRRLENKPFFLALFCTFSTFFCQLLFIFMQLWLSKIRWKFLVVFAQMFCE